MVEALKTERNAEILKRRIRGESLKNISHDFDSVSYGRIVDIAREERERIERLASANEVALEELASSYGLTEQEVGEIISDVSNRKSKRALEWEEQERVRLSEQERQLKEIYRGDLEDFWKPILECPAYIFVAFLYDGSDVFVGSRASSFGNWSANGSEVAPTHFIRIPAPPKGL
ncbi:hypothetical protein KUD11_14260 [Roseovarius sp. LXJ103]|uniref:hypothetical protein n=1 Tax=Roseovarius carneus TaxID=2853164 RepID=UPI000D60D106|nr:hypothetical protein [Roseovarius carneus]MBZ8119801.1 hypothetical protein [Roseovarius carneus]PWE34602.1 hypothetical protein DD563_00480 [Pelagicola sp. LXJ1103]